MMVVIETINLLLATFVTIPWRFERNISAVSYLACMECTKRMNIKVQYVLNVSKP
jgi:hypothetical protein